MQASGRKGAGPPPAAAESSAASGFRPTPGTSLEQVLGGEWRHEAGAACFVVESRRERPAPYARETVGAFADRLAASASGASLLAGCPLRAPFLFFDLETTGLGGGAGTYAFLIGCGWFDDGAFVTRQFVVVRFVDERAVLGAVTRELSRAGALVSFNGRSFDAPLLETRFLYHRLPWAADGLPHLDMLHVARRFWKRDQAPTGGTGCSLAALERQLLGHCRRDDVPGLEIPGRYFQFVRTGDARPLAAVLEHNRRDLLSLAALTARALHLVGSGPAALCDSREALALGWVYARAGLLDPAREAYRRAADTASAAAVRVEALRALAVSARRARSHDEAARYWRLVLEVRGCPPTAVREASEALAIHHEHRVHDLVAAKSFARQSLVHGSSARSSRAVEYRLERIERKLELSNLSEQRPSFLS